MGSDASRSLLLGVATLTVAFGYLTWQTLRVPARHPSRLVAELRLAQAAAVLLAFSAALVAGLSAAHDTVPGSGLDMALAVVWCGLALMTLVRDASAALGWLGLAFVSRALLDLLHLPGWLPGPVADAHVAGSVAANALAALCCLAPLAQRRYS
jgi:hypothetical protein